MVLWQVAGVVFFTYVVLVALLRSPRPRSVGRIVAVAAMGLLIVAASAMPGQPPGLKVWIWPPLMLLVAYWSSGMLFVAPSPPQEAGLRWLDDRLAIREVSRRIASPGRGGSRGGVRGRLPPRFRSRCWLLLALFPSSDPDAFWSVVLITDFVCFGVLPWVQTRPPRALEGGEPWMSSIRSFNLRLLGATSIQVNTFPSGHAAEASRRLFARARCASADRRPDVCRGARRLCRRGARPLSLSGRRAGGMGCGSRGVRDSEVSVRGVGAVCQHFLVCRGALSAFINALGAPPPTLEPRAFALGSGRRRRRYVLRGTII